MNDIITNPNERHLIAYSDYLVVMPEITENSTGDLHVKAADVDAAGDIVFIDSSQRAVAESIKSNPPQKVADLWRRFLTVSQSYASANRREQALTAALYRINEEMNEAADELNLCSEYEDKLSDFNIALKAEGYKGTFRFEGRKETKRFTVQRHRTIIETTVVEMEVERNNSDSYWSDIIDSASDHDTDMWEVVDEQYDTENYDIIDEETL
jgi:hypothetical protein